MCTFTNARVHVSELFRARVHVVTACTHSPSYVYALSHLFCLSLALEVYPLVSTLTHCQDPLWLSPEWGWPPLSSCWAFLFQIGLWWKGRLLISRNTATEDLYSPCPSSTTHRNHVRQPVFIKAKYLLPTPLEIGKTGPSLDYHFFLICANVQVADFLFFLYCNILER